MEREVKLTKSQMALYESWMVNFQKALAGITAIMDELLGVRMRALAEELGIDYTSADWRFDARSKSFQSVSLDQDTAPTRPGSEVASEEKAPNADLRFEV